MYETSSPLVRVPGTNDVHVLLRHLALAACDESDDDTRCLDEPTVSPGLVLAVLLDPSLALDAESCELLCCWPRTTRWPLPRRL